MDPPSKTAWAISIVGGTIAATFGGIITFHYGNLVSKTDKTAAGQSEKLDTQQTKELATNSIGSPPKGVVANAPVTQLPSKSKGDLAPPLPGNQVIAANKSGVPSNNSAKACGANIAIRIEAIKKIYYPESRDAAWMNLVKTLVECDSFDEAKAAAAAIYFPETRDAAYTQIMGALIDQKKFDGALKMVDSIYFPETRDRLNEQIIAASK